MSSGDKAASPGLTIDRAAFLLLRVKKAFKKKKQQRKEKCAPAGGECQKQEAAGGLAYQNIRGQSRGSVAVQGQTSSNGKPAPLLRSRTLPAIVAPGLNILQAQIDARYAQTSGGAIAVIPPYGSTSTSGSANGPNLGKRDSGVSSYGKLLTPRISFTDDAIVERRVSDTGPSSYYRDGQQQQQQQHKGGRLSTCSIGSSQPLVKLARLLNQRPSFTPPSDDIPRRLSWERRDGSSSSGGGGSSCLPRSSSIDSVAEWSLLGGSSNECPSGVYGAALGTGSTYGIYVEQSPPRRSPSPLLGSRGDRLSLVSPSIGRRVKGHRVILVSEKRNVASKDKMKFRRSAAPSSPRMELLRRPTSTTITSNNKLSNFKRSKSFRASFKLISKIRNHANINGLNLEPESSKPTLSGFRELQEETEEEMTRELKTKLSLKENNKPKLEELSVKTDEFSAYENPLFVDSSLDSSMGSFFFDDDNVDKVEAPSPVKPRRMSLGGEGLTVMLENGRCETHRWCTRVETEVKVKPLKPRTVDNIASFWTGKKSSVVVGKKYKKELEREPTTTTKTTTTTTTTQQRNFAARSTSGTKLHSLQGMEFLESFGKKKHQLQQQQQQQQRSHQYQLINLSSIHINNPLTAQPSLNIHLHALFAAVEHGHIDKARAILESTDVNVNSVNSDGLSPLDVAVLSSNRPLAKMLVAFGAQEGNQFKSPETLGSHLASLLTEAEHRVQELGGPGNSGAASLLEPPSSQSHRASFSSQHNNLTGCSGGGSAEDKQLALWERRARALRKMLLGFDQARPPDMPYLVTVDVTGITSVMARFQESETQDAPICTKFKIQWSFKEDFAMLCGERELLDMKQKECRIEGLLQGHRYYFRAAAGNLKGYSRFRPTTPTHLMPSSWRDIDGRVARFAGRLEQLDSLFTDVRGPEYSQETPAVQRRNHKKKTTIKQLFTATSKFQKNLRRGVFLACLLYHEDKVLVTNEDFLPVIEVDETYPSCIYNDFHWLMKVACTWDDVKSLRQDMEKSHSSSTNHFRIKLLQAAAQMQAALCIQDLGQLYHKPIRDVQGTLVFSSVNYVRSPKQVSVLNSRWLPLAKVTKKLMTHEDSNVADFLMASIQDQMAYHQASSIKLSRGLYLGYLKMQSSVDSIQVLVPTKSPNVLPHCKVRDNPHVSAEEWEYLKRMGRLQASGELYRKDECDDSEEKENASNEQQGSEQQKLFIDVVAATAKRLFSYMEISAEESLGHRLYDAEVIELSPEVSFLVAVPPAEIACSVPGAREISLQRSDLLSLPIQVFEMVHLNTYQKDVINRYSRLSCILELDTAQAQHNHREAFSSSELSIAKDKLARLQDLQSQMNSVWKSARWLIDLITFARDRGTSSIASSGICVRYLLSLERNKGNSNSLKRSLLQLPPRDPKLVKSSPGRGSWPGPSVDRSGCSQTNLLSTELSKSEQQLHLGPYPRKGSNSSNCSSASEPYKSVSGCGSGGGSSNIHGPGSSGSLCPGTSSSVTTLGGSASTCRLPPSKSEDTLHLGSKQYKQSPRNRSSATTSPLLGGSSHATSESSHSISSTDEYPVTSKTSNRLHMSKPTASIASIASTEKQPLQQLQQSKLSPEDKDIENCTRASASSSVGPMPGILQVYAAYETGLASGTSLKLHVTGRTTAREVVDLVVKQLNMAVLLKGLEGPVYAQEDLANFCLVAVIGARERCLRDDFKPLQLQNPWKKGRLYVRQKQDVLAALEHSSKHTAFL